MSDTQSTPAVPAVVPPDTMRQHHQHWVWRNNAFVVWTWCGNQWRWVDPTRQGPDQLDGYSDPTAAYAEGWRYISPAFPPGWTMPR